MRYHVLHTVKLCPSFLEVDGRRVAEAGGETSFLTDLYRRLGLDYPKFFKMDILSKVGFLASEFLLEQEAGERFVPRDDRAVLLYNRYSSMHADQVFQETIAHPEDFFPKPSVFVYTLPNIVTGEIAIRNKYHGESNFILLPEYSEQAINQAIECAFLALGTTSLLTGWLEALSENNYNASLSLLITNHQSPTTNH